MAYMKDSTGRRLDTIAVQDKIANMPVAPGMVPVGHDLLFPQSRLTGSASYEAWMWIPTTIDVSAVQFLMGSVDTSDSVTLNGGPRPSDGGPASDVRYAMSVQTVGGRITQIKMGGLALFTVKMGTVALTDMQDLDIPTGDGGFYVRLYAERDVGGLGIPGGRIFSGVPTSGQVSPGGANNTMVAGPISASITGAGTAPSPLAVYGYVPGGSRVVVGIVGDSIAAGQDDLPSASLGFLTRAFGTSGKVPYVKVARGSERALEFGGTPSIGRIRQSLIAGCTHVIHEYGSNDVTSLGAAPTQAALLVSWKKQARRGPLVYQTTITPKSTSTDNFLTTANQSPQNATDIATVNAWIRDGAPIIAGAVAATGAAGALRAGQAGHPLAGWLEVAAAVESSTTPGIWKAAPIVGTANTTSGSLELTGVTGTWGIGDRVIGPGMPVNNWVVAVNATGAGTLTLRGAATATATGVQLFSPMTNDGLHPTTQGAKALAAAPALVAFINGLQASL